MPRILRTRESRLDYEEIWDFLAVRDPGAADRILRKLDATLRLLASSPEMGRSAAEYAPRFRCFSVGSYLIFYRPIDDGIQLIRVLHGACDLAPGDFREE